MKLKLMSRRIIKGTIPYYCGLIVAGFATTGLSAGQITVTGRLTDSIVTVTGMKQPISLLSLLFTVLILSLLVIQLRAYLKQLIQLKVNYNLDHILVDFVSPRTITHIETPQYQNDLNVIRYGHRTVGDMYISFIEIGVAFVSLVAYLGIIFSHVWYLSLLIVLFSIPRFVHDIQMSGKQFSFTEQTTEISREKSQLQELLFRPLALKEKLIFNSKAFLKEKWDKAYTNELKHTRSFKLYEFFKGLKLGLMNTVGQIVIQFVLVYEVVTASITIGTYVAILAAVGMINAASSTFAIYFGHIKQYRIAKHKMIDFVGRYSPPELPTQQSIESIKNIDFRCLRFQYPNRNVEALKGITLHIQDNDTIAIVGSNGSGKSTMAKVLSGLHEVEPGQLFYNEKDICLLQRESILKQVSIVTQDFVKYPLTFRENVTLGSHQSSLNFEALHRKFPYLFEENLDPDTVLGIDFRHSRQLSGGQWQKIAITRALIKEAPFLIFDEATSALDAETEYRLIRDVLKHRKQLIAVTHRLHTCPLFATVIVLQDGRIVEKGSHKELMLRRQHYYRMFMTQQYAEVKQNEHISAHIQ